MTAPAPLPPRDIAALDVPLDALKAQIARTPKADPGQWAEQQHQFRDLDLDSACSLPGCATYPCARKEAGRA